MKTRSLNHTAKLSLAALAFSAAAVATLPAQVPHYVTTTSATPVSLQVASADAQSFALSRIAGKPLRSMNGQELGSITDFLIDPQTGTVHFAMVPSGGGQAGDTFRLVPTGALDPNSQDAVTVKLGQGQWDRVGTLVESRLQGRITLDSDLRQRLGQQFNLTNEPAEGVTEFVRASQVRGQPVRSSGSEQLGVVEDVLIDTRHRTAAIVLTPTSTFASAQQKYLVPFNQLQFAAGAAGGITTDLTRAHFQQLQQTLTPTGYPTNYPSAPFTQATQQSSGQSAASAATAVQQALARDQDAAGVQVIPESRLVLRGTVESQQKRAEIERAAMQAAPGVTIENQISVRNW